MDVDAAYELWAKEADVLAQVGRVLFGQDTRISVRLPVSLADAAVAAWNDDEVDALPESETPEQWHARSGGATLSLIGLSIEQGGVRDGDEVVVDLDAWFIGHALHEADRAGLLGDAPLSRPKPTTGRVQRSTE